LDSHGLSKKDVVFWYETHCSLVDGYQHLGGICCFHFQSGRDALKIEAAGFFKTLETIRHDIKEDHTINRTFFKIK
jgi:hypothetical protein